MSLNTLEQDQQQGSMNNNNNSDERRPHHLLAYLISCMVNEHAVTERHVTGRLQPASQVPSVCV